MCEKLLYWGANLLFSFFRTFLFVLMKYNPEGYLYESKQPDLGFFSSVFGILVQRPKKSMYKTLKFIKHIVLNNKLGI